MILFGYLPHNDLTVDNGWKGKPMLESSYFVQMGDAEVVVRHLVDPKRMEEDQ